jgi:hypothetical protein
VALNTGVRGELLTIERAIKKRWFTDTLKPKAMAAVERALTCGDPRAGLRAAQILVLMESQNQQDEHKVIYVNVATRNDNLDEIAANLGLDIGVIQAIEGETNRSTEGVER